MVLGFGLVLLGVVAALAAAIHNCRGSQFICLDPFVVIVGVLAALAGTGFALAARRLWHGSRKAWATLVVIDVLAATLALVLTLVSIYEVQQTKGYWGTGNQSDAEKGVRDLGWSASSFVVFAALVAALAAAGSRRRFPHSRADSQSPELRD